MAYNLAGLRQRVVVDKLDDDEFDPDVVDNFINDAHKEILNQFELPFQEQIFKGAIPVGSTMFQLPADVALIQSQTVKGVMGFNGMKMAWRDFFNRYPDADSNDSAAPSTWSLYGRNILLSAPTDDEYDMTIYYIKKPTELNEDTSVPDVPYEFEELLVLGAFKRVLERNEDYDLAAVVGVEYEKQLNLLVGRYGFREADGPITMRNKQTRR